MLYQPSWANPYTQQPYGMTPQVGMQQYQPPVNGILKARGRDGALRYDLPPNSTAPPQFEEDVNQNGRVFYVVSTDERGAKTLEVCDYWPHADASPAQVGPSGISREEFDKLAADVLAIREALNGSAGSVAKHAKPDDGANGADVTGTSQRPGGRD